MAVLTGNLDLSFWVPPALGRRMSAPSKLAVAAARMALNEAGLTGAVDGTRTAVVMSSSFGPVACTEQILRTTFSEGPQAVSPLTFAESVANAAAGHIAIDQRARGPNITVVQREAGILTAVGRGAAEVASGRADRAIVGGVDEMPPILHALLDRFEALARPAPDRPERARPFDRNRNGFVAAEGATVLLLENEDLARSRGVKARTRVRGFGGAFDPSAPRIGWGHGHAALGSALQAFIRRCGLGLGEVGRVISGASGSVAGDRIEGLAIREAWQAHRLPPILVPRAYTGQYGGGLLAAAVLAVSGHEFGSTPGFTEEDPELRLIPHCGGALPAADISLVTSVASGGAASWLLLERA